MKKFLKGRVILGLCPIVAGFFLPSAVHAQSKQPAATLRDLNLVFEKAISSIIALVALVSLGMLIYGGYRYLSAGSDQKAATQAQQTITYSLAGLIVTLCSWLILNFFGNALGINLNVFDLCITANCA